MKRTLIMLTLFCLLLSGTVGLAENAQDEILFRGIPWGTSLSDFIETMEGSGLFGKVYSSEGLRLSSWERKSDRNMDDFAYQLVKAGFSYSSNNEITIAGIPVSSIGACFLYSFDGERIYTEESKSMLYYASYQFNPVDIASVIPVLEGKLNRLYGKGEKAAGKTDVQYIGGNDYVRHMDTITWYGANHTGVRLYIEYNYDKVTKETSYKKLRLEYGKTNSVDMLHALKDAQAREELRNIQSNDSVDGL
ncbi:MAG: hypothetical protein MR914_09050 [Clostridiales bacterium]|nr:hypothetical protein [Clostridiales bacterium]